MSFGLEVHDDTGKVNANTSHPQMVCIYSKIVPVGTRIGDILPLTGRRLAATANPTNTSGWIMRGSVQDGSTRLMLFVPRDELVNRVEDGFGIEMLDEKGNVVFDSHFPLLTVVSGSGANRGLIYYERGFIFRPGGWDEFFAVMVCIGRRIDSKGNVSVIGKDCGQGATQNPLSGYTLNIPDVIIDTTNIPMDLDLRRYLK